MPPTVIQTENLPQPCSDWLSEHTELHICPADSLRFKELLPLVEGMVIRTYTTVGASMIESAPRLKVIGRAGVGIDNIDLVACAKNGVRVVHAPDANSEAVAQFVLSRMLANLRPTTRIKQQTEQEEWNLLRESAVCPKQFDEMTLGIIGFGRIGSRLGKLAASLGFTVLFHDLKPIDPTESCEQVQLQELLNRSDAISLHVDGRIDNTNFCNAELFADMNKGVLFINTSRGFVVDSHALANHLRHDPESSAVLDVHEPEPITADNPLLNLPNVELYPHIACKTTTATVNMGWVVKDVLAVLQGKTPVSEAQLPKY